MRLSLEERRTRRFVQRSVQEIRGISLVFREMWDTTNLNVLTYRDTGGQRSEGILQFHSSSQLNLLVPQLMKIDKRQLRVIPECFRNNREQSIALNLPRRPQPRSCPVQPAVAIPRVANQLPCSLGHGPKQRTQHQIIE